MENRKEEIQGLKRLLVGVIVSALLITMLPFENMGALVAWAATSNLQTGELAKATPINITDTTKDDGQGNLIEYTAEEQILDYLAEFSTEIYPDGLILINGTSEPLDFSQEALYFPNGKVGLDLGGDDLYTSYINVSAMGTEEGAVEPYAAIYGDEGSSIYCNDATANSQETSVSIGNNAQMVFDGAMNIENVVFEVAYSQGLIVGGEDFSVAGENDIRYYQANNYRILLENVWSDIGIIAHHEEINEANFQESEDTGERYFDIEAYISKCPVAAVMDAKQNIFEAGAVPTDVKILYRNNFYTNPGTSFMVNDMYGVYNQTGTEITIYEMNLQGETSIGYINLTGETTASFIVNGYFELMDETGSWVPCTKVTFAEGAIPSTYTTGDGISYTIDKICNETSTPVSATLPIYVSYTDLSDGDGQYTHTYSAETAIIIENDMTYIQAGTTLTLTPVGDNTIYNIMGGSTMTADSSNIVYCPNGERVITIPSYSLADGIYFEIGTLETVVATNPSSDDMVYVFGEEPFKSAEDMDYYSGAFTIFGYEDEDYVVNADTNVSSKVMYGIALEGDTDWSTNGVTVSSEGTSVTATFILIDKTLEKKVSEDMGTEIISPSATYGKQTKLTYVYTLDKASPVIQSVTATDGDGNTTELEGAWVPTGESIPDVETLWFNKLPITFTVESDDPDNTIGYTYNYGVVPSEDDWQESNTLVAEEEKEGIWWFYVRDAFDAVTGRDEGSWYTSLGIDVTAPNLYYTDANYAPDGSEVSDFLASDDENYKDYEGNLYLEVNEYGSGYGPLTLYKITENGEEECSSELIQDPDFSYMYLIRPTTQDVTYKLVASDAVGNTKTYDSFTLKGYVQDIAVEVINNTGKYNQDLTVDIRIVNTNTTNSVDNLTYTIRESDTVFTPVSGTIDTLGAGAFHDITLNIPAGKDAGEYLSTLDIQYTSTGTILENTIEKTYSYELTASIDKIDGSGTIAVDDYYFGEDFDYTATSDTYQTDTITLYFKDEADANAQYTTEVPTAVGSYRVKAVFAEGINYKELTVEDTFTISRMQASADMYTVEAPTRDDGWYEGIMNVKGANGNTISTAESGTFQETLSISEEMASFTFYIKTSTGAITDAVTLTDIKIDKTAPVISVIDGTTSTALTSGSTYDGTLHLTVSDAGVGIATITLKDNSDALIQAEDGSYYILQAEADRTYTIVGTDDLGNSVTYDTVTVKAYQQDVEVTISENEGVYGSEIAITISIKNTSNAPITNVTYALSEAETTNAFDALNGTMDKIAAGATETITVLILDGTHPGEYVSSLELSYVSAGEVEEANVEKHFTTEVLAIVLSPDASKEMYTLSTPTGAKEWYVADLTISGAEGYTLSFAEEGKFVETLTISEAADSYTFYVKTPEGVITNPVVLTGIKMDKTAPEVAEGEGIYAVEKWWQTFLEVITFNVYEAEADQIEIKAHDYESDMAGISYYISTEAIDKDAIAEITDWVAGDTVTINKSDYEKYVVYARLENNAGLVSYISSDGIILGESEIPVEPETPVEPEAPVEPEIPVEPETPVEPEETVIVLGAGKVSLKKGTAYKLEEGIWNVTGDATDYVGGIIFYVDEDGEYEFTKK